MRCPCAIVTLALAGGVSVAASNAPTLVHLLVPGFTVRELPVRLPNLNNLRFAPDGRLFALAYDGRVHVLRDTNRDGLEDTDELFWDQPTLSVPVGLALTPAGVYVSSQGKISRLRDTNSDGRADTEDIIASGWPPTDAGSGGVDATAVTLDAEGNIYFGLLVADYSNPYRIRKRKELRPDEKAWLTAHGQSAKGDPEEEVSLYDIHSPRGTIQKWSPRTKKLETIATGIRVPYTLAFNRADDLFVTDQEGATWCPNGNPLDELNQIIPGHNYGFPPRHAQWLPKLVSDPPVVAFGPQHQSSCGLVFNEPNAGQGRFGPQWWDRDAFVAGESRGKIWRVRLVKTPSGYVGQAHLIARLAMLTTDVAISPKGDLYVCCHSGLPDWGTGPKGKGRIFQISYTAPQAPQPVTAWPQQVTSRNRSNLTEVRVAFASPLDSSITNRAADMRVEYGDYVRAGDRFELLKPPYAAVNQQETASREFLKVRAARLENEGQLLVLDTDPIVRAVPHALTIPGVKAPGQPGDGATVDLDFDLFGADLSIQRDPPLGQLANQPGTSVPAAPGIDSDWIPHPDLAIAENWLEPLGRKLQSRFDSGNGTPGLVRLKARLNLPADAATFRVSGSTSFGLEAPNSFQQATQANDGQFIAELNLDQVRRDSKFLVQTKSAHAGLRFTYTVNGDITQRAMTRQQFLLDWSPTNAPVAPTPLPAPLLAGGDYESGRDLFFGDQLKCATCHRLRGEGGMIGPDLSNLISRDAASVLRDIREPSASINPDYVAYNVTLNDGTELTGFIHARDDTTIKLMTADDKEVRVRPTDVREMRPSSVSLMPTGLLDPLPEHSVRDLLTFLLNAPPEHSRAEVAKLLAATPAQHTSRLNIVLVAGKQDHGPGQHDYPSWQKRWRALLASDANVSEAWNWPSPEQFQSARVLVCYFWNHDWSSERLAQLDHFLARGGGLVLLHSAAIGNDQADQLAERTGLASYSSPRTKYRHTPLELNLVAANGNPITQGLPSPIRLLDELYWPLTGDARKVQVLATANVDGVARPLLWTYQNGPGRVFASIVGHYTWTLNDPLYRLLVLRGIAWAGGADPATFESLAVAQAKRK